MKYGYLAGYWTDGPPPRLAEHLADAATRGLTSLWANETYGSDALTPLAWYGALSRTGDRPALELGTAVVQMSARAPAATAMAAMTLDHLTGGRFTLGLGVSGPQVVEGWYGQPFDRPLERTREYVEIVRRIVRRESALAFTGNHYRVPLATAQAKALRSNLRPLRPRLPIFLAAQGPKNVELAAEIGDGWLAAFFSPRLDSEYRTLLGAGFSRRTASSSPFEVVVNVPVGVGDDVESAAATLAPQIALYVGGMGSQKYNFHRAALERAGHTAACDAIARAWASGDRAAAVAAVPAELVLDIALAGTPAQIAEQARRWEGTCATQLLLQCPSDRLPAVVDALSGSRTPHYPRHGSALPEGGLT